MDQTGKILEIIDTNTAKVLMQKHADCAHCGACNMGKGMDIIITAINEIQAKPGDTVQVNMMSTNVFKSAFIIYVIPLIMLIVGILIGDKLFDLLGFESTKELFSMTLGFILLVLSFLGIKLNEKNFKKDKKYIPTITHIVEDE